ncbi:MAG: lipid-A-disaccharide synthase [Betaproteobacteria bacterium]|nr:lipid-A-disaccharide synthase [Betaproteobacteria bacterium]
MVAGEASGDLLAAHLIDAIRTVLPQARFMGIGGPRMIAQGFEAWWPSEKLAVRGYVEVLKHYREISGIRKQLGRRLIAEAPDLFIGVDAPDFNLGLEIRLREHGLPTAHFISPSIWAWRGGRMKKIKRAAGHMLCLFPFEEPLYRNAGVPATYVGHPLADVVPLQPDQAAARARLGLPADAPVVALLPGSRQSELRYLGERFAATALLMRARHPALHFVVPLASEPTEALWRAAVKAAEEKAGPGSNMSLVWTAAPRDTHAALAACDVALVASGTATLETALFKRPMAIAYNMAPLTWALMKRMSYLPYGGLPNILCGQFVVPEFYQEDATPENLAQALGNLLNDGVARARVTARFERLHAELKCGMAPRAAAAIVGAFFPPV